MYTSDIDDVLQAVFPEEYSKKSPGASSEDLTEQPSKSSFEDFSEDSSESSSEVFPEGSYESFSDAFPEGYSESPSKVSHAEGCHTNISRSGLDIGLLGETHIPFLKTSLAFLLFSMFCALFGAVYEVFSHSVYSYYMIYAFAFPLAGGAFPYLVLGLRAKQTHAPGRTARNLWNSGIVTFAVGSILQGILEIYGTTNRLMVVYLVAGVILVLAGTGVYVYDCISTRKT